MRKLLQEVVLTTAQASITLASIDQTYTDLELEVSGIGTVGADYFKINLNGDTGTNYSRTYLQGDGTSATSGRSSNIAFADTTSGFDNTTPSAIYHRLLSYANTAIYKTILTRHGRADASVTATASLWRSLAAITQIAIASAGTGGAQMAAGTTVRLWGVK